TTRGAQNMSGLANLLGLAPSSVTRLVERLERKGLAARRSSVDSRREVAVAITTAGSVLVEQVMARRRRLIAAALTAIRRARREAMLTAFREFAEALGEPLDVDSAIDPVH